MTSSAAISSGIRIISDEKPIIFATESDSTAKSLIRYLEYRSINVSYAQIDDGVFHADIKRARYRLVVPPDDVQFAHRCVEDFEELEVRGAGIAFVDKEHGGKRSGAFDFQCSRCQASFVVIKENCPGCQRRLIDDTFL